MNWLITGGCGFIGRALIQELLLDSENKIKVLDNLSVGSKNDLQAVTDFEEADLGGTNSEWTDTPKLLVGDIRNQEWAFQSTDGADVVIHLAANTGVGPSVEDPKADADTNIFGTLNMLEACRNSNTKKFILASSGAPIGEQKPPLHEELAPHPSSPYGASKLAGEGYCSAYFQCFGIETVALRFGNVYGEGSGHKQSVVAKFIRQAIAGEDLEVFGDGAQTRDFIHISDLILAVRKAATTKDVGGEVFQIATERETSLVELTSSLLEALVAEGVAQPKIIFGPKRTGDVMRNFSDTSKAQEKLGWRSEVTLVEGLRRTVRSFI